MEIKPTDYQNEALIEIKRAKYINKNSVIIQMASGLGKTYLAGFESLNYIGKILFVCHRREILKQSKNVFTKIYSERFIKRTMGFYHGYKKQPNVEILFASIQTIGRKTHHMRFKSNEFDLIIIDEFHHALARTYRNIINYFSPKLWLGITATPYRLNDPDGFKLQELFNSKVIYNYDLASGIDGGDLTPFILIFHKDNIDYSKIRYANYKYNEKDLNKALLIEERDKAIIEEFKKHFMERRCIGFCVSVKHVDRMVKLFNKNGISADSITWKTNRYKRVQIERDFREGETKILFTRDIYNEGIDIPAVDGILLLRPTISKVIFYQQIGRGLRKKLGKKDVMILDFVGNYKNAFLHHKWLAKKIIKGVNGERQKKPEYVYPVGCKVVFNKEIIDLFEEQERRLVNEDNLIKEYYRMKNLLGRQPVSTDFCYRGKLSFFSEKSYRNVFGNWNKFLKHIGEPTMLERRFFNPTNGEMLKYYQKVKNRLGRNPKQRELKKYSYKTYLSRFKCKNWKEFREFVNEPITEITKKDFVEEYFRIKKLLGHIPTQKEMINNAKHGCGLDSIRRKFGTYIDFLKYLGEYKVRTIDLSKEEYIKKYIELKKKSKKSHISFIYFWKKTGISQPPIERKFGFWNNFVEACGDKPNISKYSKRQLKKLKKEIILKYSKYKLKYKHIPTTTQLGYSQSLIKNIFGSYSNMIKSQGDYKLYKKQRVELSIKYLNTINKPKVNSRTDVSANSSQQ